LPWSQITVVDQREEFVRLARQPEANISELCRRFGISRKTGYKWLGRESLEDRSRRPLNSPRRAQEAVEAKVVQLRDRCPAWGGRKIARVLQRDEGIELAPSTVTSVLHRHGRICQQASQAATPWQRFEHDAPNSLWQMDFKGHFATATQRCHPLTDSWRPPILCGDLRTKTIWADTILDAMRASAFWLQRRPQRRHAKERPVTDSSDERIATSTMNRISSAPKATRDAASAPPPLANGFAPARTGALASASILALLLLDIFDVTKPLPGIGLQLPEKYLAEAAMALLTCYYVIRMGFEWIHSDPSRRRASSSKIELALALVLACAVVAWYWLARTDLSSLTNVPFVPIAMLLLVGFGTGLLASSWITALPLIRSKEEALRLGLHRVPFALRAKARMSAWWLLALVFSLGLSPAFKAPLDVLWPWLFGMPIFLCALSALIELVSPKRSLAGNRVSLSEHFHEHRKAFDWHDTVYQMNGWDERAEHQPSPFMKACTDGDRETVERLLPSIAQIDRAEHSGWTPLMMAVAQQHEDIVRLLLVRGANPNVANILGRSPLGFAANYGNERLVMLLLEFGATPNAVSTKFREPPLHAAAQRGHRGIVELLLHAGADPAIRDIHKKTPLEYAEQAGHGEIAALLRLLSNNQPAQT
jgi:transposase-like protein